MAAEPVKKRYIRGQIIFNEGDAGDEMYLIQAGSIKIMKKSGDKLVTLGIFKKNEFFGEMALLSNRGRSGTALAVEDCELLVINTATFADALQSAPKWLGVVFKSLARRLQDMNDRVGQDLVYVGKKYPGNR